MTDSSESVTLIVVLVNGVLATLLIVCCFISYFLKQRDNRIRRQLRANLAQARNASTDSSDITPMDYTESPPSYSTVLENRDVYIRRQSEIPPPDYDEVIKLHRAESCVYAQCLGIMVSLDNGHSDREQV
ncbi:uncharacterized protein LOC117289525 [Asterias rubens]|uniref:uncharacterized protein LOC117289525 n=1 Tax=Asterias rubens TaxID=7604 RepID=UPI00145599AF|nr:uncharacterized protein LOC117289525 [Asterias rubens]